MTERQQQGSRTLSNNRAVGHFHVSGVFSPRPTTSDTSNAGFISQRKTRSPPCSTQRNRSRWSPTSAAAPEFSQIVSNTKRKQLRCTLQFVEALDQH